MLADGAREAADVEEQLPRVRQRVAPRLQGQDRAFGSRGQEVFGADEEQWQLIETAQRPAERTEAHRQQQPVGVGDAPATVGQVLACLLQIARGGSRQDDTGLAEGRVLIAQLLDRLRPARHCGHLVEQPVARAGQGAGDAVPLRHQAPKVLL
jgi:hypothetical protein